MLDSWEQCRLRIQGRSRSLEASLSRLIEAGARCLPPQADILSAWAPSRQLLNRDATRFNVGPPRAICKSETAEPTKPADRQIRTNNQPSGRPALFVCAIDCMSRELLTRRGPAAVRPPRRWRCWCLLLLPLVVAMVVVAAVVVVAAAAAAVMEVEDGPALEEAGTATAPTPGLISTSGPVDSTTATPGSFRLSSPSLFLSLSRSRSLSIPSSLSFTLSYYPSRHICRPYTGSLLSCFFFVHAQHLFSGTAVGSCSISSRLPPPLRLRHPPHLTHATFCSCLSSLTYENEKGASENCLKRLFGVRILFPSHSLFLSLSPFLSALLFLSLPLSVFRFPFRNGGAGGRRHPRDSPREISDWRLCSCVSTGVISSS